MMLFVVRFLSGDDCQIPWLLVKIDPKAIGVGQYQHDVDQTKLKRLDNTVIAV
jgi:hypothetical protein